ncbi:MAG: hypothetical protein WEB05_06020 [Solirubrobacterales bacterium]
METLTPIIAAASPFYWLPFGFIFIALFIALWGTFRENRSDLTKAEEREK